MVCQRRIEPLDECDNLPLADLEDMKVNLIVPLTGKRHAVILRYGNDHLPRVRNDLMLSAKADLLGVHASEYVG